MKNIITHLSPVPRYLLLLRPKYLFQHSVLEHSQPMSFPQCKRPNLILIQSNRKNNTSIHFNLYIFDWKLEDKRFCTEWQQAVPEFSLLLIYSWMQFWFYRIVPKYLCTNTVPVKTPFRILT
jgi:hypothetical protein